MLEPGSELKPPVSDYITMGTSIALQLTTLLKCNTLKDSSIQFIFNLEYAF